MHGLIKVDHLWCGVPTHPELPSWVANFPLVERAYISRNSENPTRNPHHSKIIALPIAFFFRSNRTFPAVLRHKFKWFAIYYIQKLFQLRSNRFVLARVIAIPTELTPSITVWLSIKSYSPRSRSSTTVQRGILSSWSFLLVITVEDTPASATQQVAHLLTNCGFVEIEIVSTFSPNHPLMAAAAAAWDLALPDKENWVIWKLFSFRPRVLSWCDVALHSGGCPY